MLIDHDAARSLMNSTPMAYTSLAGRAVLRVSGPDRVAFLQGLVSNDVTKAVPGRAVYACFLTPQGKFLHEMVIYAGDDDTLYLDTEAGDRAADLKKRLGLYKLRSDVTVDDMPDMSVLAVYGKEADKTVLPADVISAPDPRCPAMGKRVICATNTVDAVTAALETGGAVARPFEDYDAYRLRMAVPDGSRDMQVERATLMESGIDELNGISWDKGCYMGQELTSRMKYRNLGKRRLVVFEHNGDGADLEPGAEIKFNNKRVGELRSVAGGYAFGLVRVSDILDARQLPEICHIENVELKPVSKLLSETSSQ